MTIRQHLCQKYINSYSHRYSLQVNSTKVNSSFLYPVEYWCISMYGLIQIKLLQTLYNDYTAKKKWLIPDSKRTTLVHFVFIITLHPSAGWCEPLIQMTSIIFDSTTVSGWEIWMLNICITKQHQSYFSNTKWKLLNLQATWATVF